MHEKTAVPALIAEIYTFLKQADSRELSKLFRQLDKAKKESDKAEERRVLDRIDNFETHIVPIIADIDAGFGNEEATYLLAKKMIEAGAACIQMENQVIFISTFILILNIVIILILPADPSVPRCLTPSSAAIRPAR